MSVTYTAKVIRGWACTREQQETFNELTNYQYEDDWIDINPYDESPKALIFFGITLRTLEPGTLCSMSYILARCVKDEFAFNEKCQEEMLQMIAQNKELYNIFSPFPNIYIASCVN